MPFEQLGLEVDRLLPPSWHSSAVALSKLQQEVQGRLYSAL